LEKLIYKFLSHTISDSEKEELRNWLNDKKNYETFKNYVKDDYVLTTLLNDLNVDEAYNKVWNKANGSKIYKLNPWYKSNLLKYAAILLLFISVGYVYFTKNNTSVDISTPIIVNNNIEPIKSKAVLTLQDGSTVVLGKGQNYTANNVEAHDEELVYSPESKQTIDYNFLTVPRGGEFHVKLSDGTQVWLNSASQIKYPNSFIEGQVREVELVYGEAYFDVSPSTEHKGASFKVLSAGQEVEVLGTEFNVKAYSDETYVFTTLVEGSIALEVNGQKRILKPDEMATHNTIDHSFTVKTVDVFDEVSWRNNVFSFKSKSLKEIMKVLSRWYDMDVEFQDKSIENTKFIGVLDKNQDIEEIVENIKNLGFISSYEIHNKTLILK
jgi:hypothetical protein